MARIKLTSRFHAPNSFCDEVHLVSSKHKENIEESEGKCLIVFIYFSHQPHSTFPFITTLLNFGQLCFVSMLSLPLKPMS